LTESVNERDGLIHAPEGHALTENGNDYGGESVSVNDSEIHGYSVFLFRVV
jgi:hypothetical protein